MIILSNLEAFSFDDVLILLEENCGRSFLGPGARFSKVPIINGPGRLLLFAVKIEVSIVLHLT